MKHKVILLALGMTLISAPSFAWDYHHYGYHHGYYDYGYHGGGDEAGILLAGLVIGGLIGYFINEGHHHRHDHRTYYYEDTRYRTERTAYYQRPYVRQRSRVIIENQTVDSEFYGENCLMTREYTTEISIDGQLKPAYGTRCLKNDGSWLLGRAKLAPEF